MHIDTIRYKIKELGYKFSMGDMYEEYYIHELDFMPNIKLAELVLVRIVEYDNTFDNVLNIHTDMGGFIKRYSRLNKINKIKNNVKID